jgi:protein transport protein SEC61 subunit gamma-like protein
MENINPNQQNAASKENFLNKSKNFMSSHFSQYVRVWRLLKKPTRQEFQTIAKISSLGLLLIGAIGFIISVLITLIRK